MRAAVSSAWSLSARNLVVYPAAFLIIGFLWLSAYASDQGIPLRVHAGSLGALVPWLAGAGLASIATLVVSLMLVVAAAWWPLGGRRGRERARDALQLVHSQGPSAEVRNVGTSLLLFGVPIAVATGLLLISLMDEWPLKGAWLYIAGAVGSGFLAFTINWGRARRRADFLSSQLSYVLLLVVIAGVALTFAIGSLRMLPHSADSTADGTTIILVEAFWWAAATHVAFAPSAALAVAAVVRVVRVAVFGIVFLSSIPMFATFAGSVALGAMGLGANVPVRLSLLDSRFPGGTGADEITVFLVLDTGDQLFVRPCASTQSRSFLLLSWEKIQRMELLSKAGCE